MSVVTLSLYESYRDTILDEFRTDARACRVTEPEFEPFKMTYLSDVFARKWNVEKRRNCPEVLKFILQEGLHAFPVADLVEPDEPFDVFSDGYYELCYFILYPMLWADML